MSELKKDAGYYLERMTAFARERASSTNYDAAGLARKDRYIRIGGNGFRPISIHPAQPCGALLGVPKPYASFAKAQAAAENAMGTPGNAKPEHRLQAFLIKVALTDPGWMPALLGCSDLFDALHFVTDELKLDAIRADVIFLARKGDQYFPVLMELKVGRQLGRLDEQLARAKNALLTYANRAREFMSAAVGSIRPEQIDIGLTCSVIVWPGLVDPARASKRVVENAAARRYFVEFPIGELDSTSTGNLSSTFARGGTATSSSGASGRR